MRATVTIVIPVDATASQLTALAALLGYLQRGAWAYLANSFGRLNDAAAQWPAPLAEVLGGLGLELRRAAHERAALAGELQPER